MENVAKVQRKNQNAKYLCIKITSYIYKVCLGGGGVQVIGTVYQELLIFAAIAATLQKMLIHKGL